MREDCDLDDLVDVIEGSRCDSTQRSHATLQARKGAPSGNTSLTAALLSCRRVYIPAIYAVNKIDQITLVRAHPAVLAWLWRAVVKSYLLSGPQIVFRCLLYGL